MELNYHFNTETFRAAWEDWKYYRKKILKKPIKEEQRALNALFKESRQDELTAIFMMEFSRDNGYQGLFYRNPNTQITNGQSAFTAVSNPNNKRTAQSYFDKINGGNSQQRQG